MILKISPAELSESLYRLLNEYRDFKTGNIIHYVNKYKDWNSLEDLKDARNYIDMLIKGREN